MKKVGNQYVPLYRYEILCYTIIWASGVIYVAYNVFDISSSKSYDLFL